MLKKKIILLKTLFRFYMGFFRPNEHFYVLKILLTTYNVIFYSLKENLINLALNLASTEKKNCEEHFL